MKNAFVKTGGFLIMLVLLAACSRKANQPVEQVPVTETPITVTPVEPPPPAKVESVQVAGFQKTPCYGRCPVYQVWFYADGKVKWYGRNNVERKGWYEARVDASVLKEIEKEAQQTGFFNLAEKYPPDHRIADLPSTITFMKIGEKGKEVINTHGAPENLEAFEKYLENLIENLAWEPAEK